MDKSPFAKDELELQSLLRELREKAGLRQQDVADAVGEPQSFVSKYETGERRLDILELRAICTALGISLSSFVKRLEKRIS